MKNIHVYTINNCGYCNAAKSLIKSHGLDFLEINITDDDAKKMELIEKTHHRTMPQIFIDGEFIGGYMELKKYFQERP